MQTLNSIILSYQYFYIPCDTPVLVFCFPVKLSLQKHRQLSAVIYVDLIHLLTASHTKTTVVSLSQPFLTCHAVGILLEKLLVKIFTAFYAISRFTSMFTRGCHMAGPLLSHTNPVHTLLSCTSRQILLCSSHLCHSSSTMLCISNGYILPCEVYCSYLLLFQV